jgi:type 1 glutamine amidotransferase
MKITTMRRLLPSISLIFLSCPGYEQQPQNILLLTGHDYPGHKWQETAPLLADAVGSNALLQVEIIEDPAFLASPKLAEYDGVILHYMNWQQQALGTEARENIRKFISDGGGLVLVHFACGAFTKWDKSGEEPKALGTDWPEFANLAGRYWNPELKGHDPRGPFIVKIKDKSHPITAGIDDFETNDELYTCLDGSASVDTLAFATSVVDGKDHLMAFTLEYGKGKVFHSPLGHDVEAFTPTVCQLYRQGCAWTVGVDVSEL